MEVKASEKIDILFELASKVKPIDCKECGFKGQPLHDGRCPKCGSICGMSIPTNGADKGDQLYSKSEAVSNFVNAIADSNNFYSSLAY